jgi:hypothetical protein
LNQPEHSAMTPALRKTGRFAAPSAVLGAKGSRTPIGRISLAITAALLALLALGAPSALAAAPTVTIDPSPTPSYTTVEVNGTIDPEGGPAAIQAYYEWGQVGQGITEFELVGEISEAEAAGSSPISFPATIQRLKPGREYEIRLTAFNGEYGEVHSPEPNPTFTTLTIPNAPVPVAEAATEVAYTSAELNGSIDPEESPVAIDYHYEYTRAGEGAWNQAGGGELSEAEAAGTAPISLPGVAVGGLSPATEYEFKLIAEDGEVFESGIQAFTTEAVAKPTVTLDPVTTLTARSAHLVGHVDPNAPGAAPQDPAFDTSWRFECTPECPGLSGGAVAADDTSHEVSADTTGLIPGTTYEVTLIAENAGGSETAGPVSFTTPFAAPGPSAPSFTAVTDQSATPNAEVNPGGAATSVHFEYVTQAAFLAEGFANPARTADVSVGSGTNPVPISATIAELTPGTTYVVRVVASNSVEAEVPGEVGTFTTQRLGAAALPDGRGWELVTPPNKHGSPLSPLSYAGSLIQAAADGGALTYASNGPIISDTSGNPRILASQNVSHRTDQGWLTEDITSPAEEPIGLGNISEYTQFSENLSVGALEPVADTLLSPQATAPTIYLHQPDGSFLPLVTASNVLPGSVFFHRVPSGPSEGRIDRSVEYVDGTTDLSSVVLTSCAKLTADATEACEPESTTTRGIGNLYVWKGGSLKLASSPPQGESFAPQAQPKLGDDNKQVRHAITDDGNRVIFRALRPEGNFALYLRDIAREETVRIDESQPGAPDQNSSHATFQEASSDGSKIFFTDAAAITPDSTAGQGSTAGEDLYMCEIRETGGRLHCDLTDLTVAHAPSVTAGVGGNLIGISENGDRAYFAAAGDLTASSNPRGEQAVENSQTDACNTFETAGDQYRCNIFVSDTETNTVKLVAVLSVADQPVWNGRGFRPDLGYMTARVSPNGRYLAFMSERSLTGYDNRDAVSGERDEEVFLYDSQTETLSCVSCNPSGARPSGMYDSGEATGSLVDYGVWSHHWLAGSIPGWTHFINNQARHQPRYLSNSGRLFFNANDSLAPKDSNGTEDVYEFEPPGVGDCAEQSSTFSPVSGGCVALISSGTSGEESAFLDASESGDDIFFLTGSQLTSADIDGVLDIYDARVGGGELAAIAPVDCEGDACQQPAVPPNHPTPGTALVNGPENVKECRKGKKLKHGKCVRKKSKKHKQKHPRKKGEKQKRANRNRGGAK